MNGIYSEYSQDWWVLYFKCPIYSAWNPLPQHFSKVGKWQFLSSWNLCYFFCIQTIAAQQIPSKTDWLTAWRFIATKTRRRQRTLEERWGRQWVHQGGEYDGRLFLSTFEGGSSEKVWTVQCLAMFEWHFIKSSLFQAYWILHSTIQKTSKKEGSLFKLKFNFFF